MVGHGADVASSSDRDDVFARLRALTADRRPRRAQTPEQVRLRARLTARHVGVLAGVLLLGGLAAGWAVLHARALPAAPLTPSIVASGTRTLSSSVAIASPSPTELIVHVAGAVARPGLVRLPAGSRVADAIDAAGGLVPGADIGELNLAALVADGAQIIVGTRENPRGELRTSSPLESSSSTSSPAAGVKVNLNTATLAQLDALPGVGPVTAQKILSWRATHGRFTRVEQIAEIDGIGPKTYAEIAPHVYV